VYSKLEEKHNKKIIIKTYVDDEKIKLTFVQIIHSLLFSFELAAKPKEIFHTLLFINAITTHD
jgi:hypothetical protein